MKGVAGDYAGKRKSCWGPASTRRRHPWYEYFFNVWE